MAKTPTKAKQPAKKKKRKAQSVAPREAAPGTLLGSVSIPVQVQLSLPNPGVFNEVVIEWGCLGLSEEPDSIVEISANHDRLDTKRPITTSEEGLHMYFDPPLNGAGIYGFRLLCGYNEAVEVRSSSPEDEEDDDLTPEQREGEKYSVENKKQTAE